MPSSIQIKIGSSSEIAFFVDKDVHASIDDLQATIDAGGALACTIEHSGSSNDYQLKTGIRPELLFLHSRRILCGTLYDSDDDVAGWLQVGRCELKDCDTGETKTKVFFEVRFPTSDAEQTALFTALPLADDWLTVDPANANRTVQHVSTTWLPNESLATLTLRERLMRWLSNMQVSDLKRPFWKLMIQKFIGFLIRLLSTSCPSTVGCPHIVAGFPFWQIRTPQWTCVQSDAPEYLGGALTIVVRMTTEVTDTYGNALAQMLAEAAIEDFQRTWLNSGIAEIPVSGTVLDNSGGSRAEIEESGASNSDIVQHVVDEKLFLEPNQGGHFHVTLTNRAGGESRGNVVVVGFQAIGLGMLQHEVAHSFGVNHHENYFATSSQGGWATLIAMQGVRPQRINMLSTENVLFHVELETPDCGGKDAAGLVQTNIGFVQHFPKETLP